MEIKSYRVIVRDNLDDLVKDVAEAIKDGYEPLGGISLSEISIGQALVLKG